MTTADLISPLRLHDMVTQLPHDWESPVTSVAPVLGDDDDDCGDDDDEPCVPDDDGDEDDGEEDDG